MIDIECTIGLAGIIGTIASEIIGLSKTRHNSITQVILWMFKKLKGGY